MATTHVLLKFDSEIWYIETESGETLKTKTSYNDAVNYATQKGYNIIKVTGLEDDIPVKCTNCGWLGSDDDLIKDDEDDECPQCNEKGCIMDLDYQD
jgi:predicted Zn-ribbon and HTH transcriptional regulator